MIATIRKHAAASFFAIVFLISWGAGVATHVHPLVLFPILILSVAGTGISLTRLVDGRDGLRRFWRRQAAWGLGRWFALVLVPPGLILLALLILRSVAGSSYSPNFFPPGLLFGVPAGLFEEVGWTGYALPKLTARMSWRRASVVLGALWGLWHLPVLDALGAASPHGAWLPAFGLAFIALLCALRVLISWAAMRTDSLPIAQMIHMTSTGSLVMFGPPRVTAAQETMWYVAYGALLWVVAAAILIYEPRRGLVA